jgi:hypothetical protein
MVWSSKTMRARTDYSTVFYPLFCEFKLLVTRVILRPYRGSDSTLYLGPFTFH